MINSDCTCPYEEGPLGVLHGISMGRGMVRMTTTEDCPVHDTCQRYTVERRSHSPNGRWLYCTFHGTKDCPAESTR